jgi:hypothetical protein
MNYTNVRKENSARSGTETYCRCGTSTLRTTLSDYGRCFPCFQAYCREPSYDRGRSKAAERIRAEIAAMGRKVPA